ncbi:MAG: DUF3108 domain-containing protein [Burkholderiales bacterium]|nr:DUF3108 domain-containing protein [Burkholderiales bacterium]
MNIAKLSLLAALLCTPLVQAQTPSSAKSATLEAPPSADLIYSVKIKHGWLTVNGQGFSKWELHSNGYSLTNTARAGLLGKTYERGSSSNGGLNEAGLSPKQYTETPLNRETTITTFNADKKLSFSVGAPSIDFPSGAQDRASVAWQLATVARSHPEKFVVGSEWNTFVAGRRDADIWRFKVVAKETINTKLGEIATIHFIKAPPAESQEQQVDLWLAPSMEWYPVQIRLKEADGDFVEQTVERIVRK